MSWLGVPTVPSNQWYTTVLTGFFASACWRRPSEALASQLRKVIRGSKWAESRTDTNLAELLDAIQMHINRERERLVLL
ncbi:hypothetical protein BM1_01486 [Bipolaris maydis]|nr:hypothetical protein BM1_01486 [Bipolaris maydis]